MLLCCSGKGNIILSSGPVSLYQTFPHTCNHSTTTETHGNCPYPEAHSRRQQYEPPTRTAAAAGTTTTPAAAEF